jgi:Domain of unknown function (DUF1835)
MSSTLHLRCGTDIRDTLRAAAIPGEFLEWADPVCQGPVLALPEPDYLEHRRAWLSAAWDIPRAELDIKLRPMSSLPVLLEPYAEVCLWFEHDWYDQSILIQVLAALAEARELWPRLRIVSIDRHPKIRRFIGLGQLTPELLGPLYPQRVPIVHEAFDLATRAWNALREPTPDRLRNEDWRSDALPFLAGAIARHLDEFPRDDDGLGLTQRLTLQAIADAQASDDGYGLAVQIFGRLVSELEPMPWLGDSMWWGYLRELAAAPVPLIEMLGEFPSEQLTLTPLGTAVLRGEQHWLRVSGPPPHGPSRWRGGVEILPHA